MENFGLISSPVSIKNETEIPPPPKSIFDGIFERIHNDDSNAGPGGTTWQAKCLLCKDKNTIIKGLAGISSNFITHFKRMHPTEAQAFYENRDRGKMLKGNLFSNSSFDYGPSPKKRHFEGSLSKRLFNGLFEKLRTEHDTSSTPKVVARCLLCTHKEIKIRAAMGVTSNFITHLRRKHPNEFENCYMKGQEVSHCNTDTFPQLQHSIAAMAQHDEASSFMDSILKNSRSRKSIFNHYFEKLQDDQQKLIAKCRICGLVIKGSPQITSNFIRHLKNKHIVEYVNFYKNETAYNSMKSEQDDDIELENDNDNDDNDDEDIDNDDEYDQYKNFPLETVVKEEPQAFHSFYFNETEKTQPVVNAAIEEQQHQIEVSEENTLEESINTIKEEAQESIEQDSINAETINNLIDSLNAPPDPIGVDQSKASTDDSIQSFSPKSKNGKISLFNGIYTKWRKSSLKNKMIANCLLCGAQIQGNLKITSNFISHLKRRHPKTYIEYHNSKITGIADMPTTNGFDQKLTVDKYEDMSFNNDDVDSSSTSIVEQDINSEYQKTTVVEKFFEKLVKRSNNSIEGSSKIYSPRVCFARCRICKKVLRGVDKVSSNYIQHLRRKHPEEYAMYTSSKKISTDQNKFENDVVDFVIQTGQSLNIVENLYFKRLFEDRLFLKLPSLNEIAELARAKGYFMPGPSARNERQQFGGFTY